MPAALFARVIRVDNTGFNYTDTPRLQDLGVSLKGKILSAL
jgi:hypothetical protein